LVIKKKTISLNNFQLGTFLLKDREQLDFVLKKNPIEILEDITYPANSINTL